MSDLSTTLDRLVLRGVINSATDDLDDAPAELSDLTLAQLEKATELIGWPLGEFLEALGRSYQNAGQQ